MVVKVQCVIFWVEVLLYLLRNWSAEGKQNNAFVKPFVSGSCRIGAIITSSASFSL